MRRFTPIELAIGVSLVGCICAVAIPVFVREVHASRFVEPTEGLARLSSNACALAEVEGRFADTTPLTPANVPRGKKEIDPPNTWDAPTWKRLAFRASPENTPHAYSFAFESLGGGAAFVARAQGDLDGDGVLSKFEVRGTKTAEKATVEPGLYVESELE